VCYISLELDAGPSSLEHASLCGLGTDAVRETVLSGVEVGIFVLRFLFLRICVERANLPSCEFGSVDTDYFRLQFLCLRLYFCVLFLLCLLSFGIGAGDGHWRHIVLRLLEFKVEIRFDTADLIFWFGLHDVNSIVHTFKVDVDRVTLVEH